MSLLEIISKLCEVTEILSEIVKKQQIVIEQSKIEEMVKEELRQGVEEADEATNVLEYRLRTKKRSRLWLILHGSTHLKDVSRRRFQTVTAETLT